MDDFEFRQFCTDIDSVQVVFPAPVNLGSDISTCDVSSVTLNAGPGVSYLWSTGDTTQSISPSVSGQYSVIVQDGNCTSQDTIVVTSIAQQVSLGNDVSLCEVFSVELNAGPGISYQWNTGETSQIIHPTSPGIYWVSVNDGTCTTRDSVELTGVFGEGALFVPNTFTPDGNRTNDEFFVYGNGIVDYRLRIFNRWGEIVFESADPLQGWNGQYHSTIVEEGTYVYVIDYTTSCNGTFSKKVGHVNVVR
jgi:gliding motility-associated-like protein